MSRPFIALVVTMWLIVALYVLCPLHPAQATYALTRDEARAVICFEGSIWDCDHMLAIAWRESRWQPGAINRDCGNDGTYRYVCWGLLQVLSPCECGLLDPYENAYRAHEKYLNGGVAVHWRATQ